MKPTIRYSLRYGLMLLATATLATIATTASAYEVFVDRGASRLVSHWNAGAGGAHVSAVPANITARGFNAGGSTRVSNGALLPTTGQSMRIRRITFFAYQRDSGTTSTITGVTLQAWMYSPAYEGRRLIYGDLHTNRMVHTEFANIYRIDLAEDPLNDTSRPIMKVVAEVDFHMPAAGNQYFLDWQFTGSMPNNGPWVPPVLETPQNYDVAYHYDGSEWNPLVSGDDNVRQSLPFIIEGEYSDGIACTLLNQTITGSAAGTHLRFRDAAIGSESQIPGGNLVIYDQGGLSFRWLGTGFPDQAYGVSENNQWLVLEPGDVINGFHLKLGSGPATLWRDGADGYLGFRYGCGTQISCYGFLRMKSSPGTPGKPGFPLRLYEMCQDVKTYSSIVAGPRLYLFGDDFGD